MPTRNPRAEAKPRRQRRATTNEVLGDAVHDIDIDPKWRWHYDTLLDLRNHFLQQEKHLKRDADEQYTGIQREQADVATNTFNRDWALGTLAADQDAIYEIDEAINRIRDGTYGICEFTGKPIAHERLRAIPWTRFSLEGEREAEKQGALERLRPKLGPEEPLPHERLPESYGREEEL